MAPECCWSGSTLITGPNGYATDDEVRAKTASPPAKTHSRIPAALDGNSPGKESQVNVIEITILGSIWSAPSRELMLLALEFQAGCSTRNSAGDKYARIYGSYAHPGSAAKRSPVIA